MPLYIIEHPKLKGKHLPLAKQQYPMLLFGDITGDIKPIYELGQTLDLLNEGRRTIIGYHDERLEDYTVKYTSLKQQTETIFNKFLEVFKKVPDSKKKSYPLLIFGYSMGCIYAVLMAQLAKQAGLEPYLILLDGPAAWAIQNYFNEQKENSTDDLAKIANLEAFLSGLRMLDIPQDFIKQISSEPLKNRLEKINALFLEQSDASTEDLKAFKRYNEIVAENLENLCQGNQAEEIKKLDTIHLLLTQETLAKYPQDKNGGWQDYADKIEILKDKDKKLYHLKHTELLKGENCDLVAKLIQDKFLQLVPETKPFQNNLEALVDEFRNAYPHVPKEKLAQYFLLMSAKMSGLDHSIEHELNEFFAQYPNLPKQQFEKVLHSIISEVTGPAVSCNDANLPAREKEVGKKTVIPPEESKTYSQDRFFKFPSKYSSKQLIDTTNECSRTVPVPASS